VRSSGYKLIRSAEGREELYDLEADPEERRDIAVENEAVVAELRKLLAERRASFGPDAPAEPAAVNPELRQRLQALGYADRDD